MAALRGGYSHAMRHVLFAAVMTLFVLTIAQNWAHYSTALMIAAWIRYDGRLDARIF